MPWYFWLVCGFLLNVPAFFAWVYLEDWAGRMVMARRR